MNYLPLEIAFWILLFLLVHCYVLFPVTLPFVSEIFCRKDRKVEGKGKLPKVSILVSAFNEEAVIEKKIQNLTDKFCKEIDDLAVLKEKEIMEI